MNIPAYKIENKVDEGERLPRVSPSDAKYITEGRVKHKLTRARLAQLLNMKEKDLAEIENRTAFENKADIRKIKRFLDSMG